MPVTMPSDAKQAPIAPWGVSYDGLTKEEKTRAQFTDGSACYVATTKMWIAVALQPLSGTTLKDSSEGKMIHHPQNFGQYTWSYILHGKINDQIVIVY